MIVIGLDYNEIVSWMEWKLVNNLMDIVIYMMCYNEGWMVNKMYIRFI